MKVLLVEDDYLTVDSIVSTLKSSFQEVKVDVIRTESEFIDNFAQVVATPPDFIILDVMLRWADPSAEIQSPPERIFRDGFYRAGIRCLQMLLDRPETSEIPVLINSVVDRVDLELPSSRLPKHVLVVRKEVDDRGLVRHIRSLLPTAQARRAHDQGVDIDFAVITPLVVEFNAVKSRLSDGASIPADYPAHEGRIGSYRVASFYPGEPGNYAAADFARYVVQRTRPRWLVVLGVAGAVDADDISAVPDRGDVVVASKIYPYEYGKLGVRFVPRDSFDTDTDLRWMNFVRVHADTPQLATGWGGRIGSRKPDGSRARPRLWVGPVASGEKVVDHPDHRLFREAMRLRPRPLAVEMEGAGTGVALRRLRSEGHLTGFLMIRGISDLSRPITGGEQLDDRTRERDSWKRYAAQSAAAYLDFLLSSHGGFSS